MNERLKELWNRSNHDEEVFAELIIRECADICRYHPSIIVSNNWSGHDVAQDIVQRFEEHFGVEE